MKALIIADDSIAVERFSAVLNAAGYDIIVYRWLIKAIDNIEEIAPHLILVSALEYPRHWKTLTQYAESGICGVIPQIILFTEKNFSSEEQEKAKLLGVRGFFSSYDVDGLDDLRTILKKHNDIYKGEIDNSKIIISAIEEDSTPTVDEVVQNNQKNLLPIDKVQIQDDNLSDSDNIKTEEIHKEEFDSVSIPNQSSIEITETNPITEELSENQNYTPLIEPESSIKDPIEKLTTKNIDITKIPSESYTNISLIFTNPVTKEFVTGKVINFDGKTCNFKPDYKISNLEKNTLITRLTLKTDSFISFVSAKLLECNENLKIEIQESK